MQMSHLRCTRTINRFILVVRRAIDALAIARRVHLPHSMIAVSVARRTGENVPVSEFANLLSAGWSPVVVTLNAIPYIGIGAVAGLIHVEAEPVVIVRPPR
jgi:hypothetical protein